MSRLEVVDVQVEQICLLSTHALVSGLIFLNRMLVEGFGWHTSCDLLVWY